MKLCYRGIHHNHQSLSLEVQESEIVEGTYRGQRYHDRFPRHIPTLKEKPILKYRGVSYQHCPVIQTEASLSNQLAAIAKRCQNPSKHPTATRPQRELAHTQHLNNIRQNLERRLQVAKANGDEQLISLLEAESQQLVM